MVDNPTGSEDRQSTASSSRWRRLLAHARRCARLAPAILFVFAAILGTGTGVGYWLASEKPDPAATEVQAAQDNTSWTCAMMCVQLPEPGLCPVCNMELVPMDDDVAGPRHLRMSEAAMALADIQTTPVRRRYVAKSVRMVGKVQYDETRLAYITARVPGRLDRLYVDYTGVTVRQGDQLVSMYSPELIVAQQELLVVHRNSQRRGSPAPEQGMTPLRLAVEKLRLLGLLDRQIEEIKRRGTPSDHLTIHAPLGGVVIERHATEGMYVKTGMNIYTIADLSQVWVLIDAYESDVPWLRFGQEVEFTAESHPGEVFRGRIAFIDPVLNERTRTVRVRVNAPNPDGKLKPGMFVRARVRSQLAQGGDVFDPALAGKWISPMHPEIVKDEPGQCDICGMDLVPAEELGFVAPEKSNQPPLVIPATAPLVTGQRAVVYVRLPDSEEEDEDRSEGTVFEGREVLLGPRAGDYYLVRHGLEEGDLVVTQGNFKIDSALQIQAKPSMMSIAGHDPLTVPERLLRKLTPVYQHYLKVQEALADDEAAEAAGYWRAMHAALEGTPEGTVDRRLDAAWSAARARLQDVLTAGDGVEELAPLRARFEPLAEAMLDLAGTFGHSLAEPLYEAYCPMVDGNRGAPWLQAGEVIANPYFGYLMLRCGEIRRPFLSGPP